jgi:hypothetical protein
MFHQGLFCSYISLKAKYIVLLKNVRDKGQFSHLARQVYPEDSVGLLKAYGDATDKPHGYLLLDLEQYTYLLRFRTHIFQEEEPPIIYTPPTDGTSNKTIQLPRSTSD